MATKKERFEQRLFSSRRCLLKENISIKSNKARSTIRHTFTKEKTIPDNRGEGAGQPGPNPKYSDVAQLRRGRQTS